MDWSQIAFGCALIGVLAASREGWLISLTMGANFAMTLLWASYPLSVAMVDSLCGSVLLLGNGRARMVGALFGAMVVWAVAARWFGLSDAATYTIVDVLAFAQLFIIGGGAHGVYRRIRGSRLPVGGWSADYLRRLARGGSLSPSVAFFVSRRK
jgi:hypothetical protein